MKQQTAVQHEVKPMNYKQLQAAYGMTYKTLKAWLEPFMDEIGELRGKAFTLRQMRIIYDKLGEPKSDL